MWRVKVDKGEGGFVAHICGPASGTGQVVTPASIEENPPCCRGLLLQGCITMQPSGPHRAQTCATTCELLGGRPSSISSYFCCHKLHIWAGAIRSTALHWIGFPSPKIKLVKALSGSWNKSLPLGGSLLHCAGPGTWIPLPLAAAALNAAAGSRSKRGFRCNMWWGVVGGESFVRRWRGEVGPISYIAQCHHPGLQLGSLGLL